MQTFFIEFRLHGYAKEYAKTLIFDVARRYQVKGITRGRVVPHIALYGPASTNNMKKVISGVEDVSRKYTLVPFKIKGFDYFDRPHKVIYLDIDPSPKLKELRFELAKELNKISISQPWDKEVEYHFHATIAFKGIDSKFDQIWSYIKQREEPNINQNLLRVTILGSNRRILYEYDLLSETMLSRRQALSRRQWRRTINRLRELQGLRELEKQSFSTRILKFLKVRTTKRSIYFIGDLHLDHANIIKYCHRPFSNVHEMNRVLVSNWEKSIKSIDKIYFLGDLAFGRNSKPTSYWLKRLPGKITFIKGSHDREVKKARKKEILKYGKYTFVMLHDPAQIIRRIPKENTWIVHGHKHNNDIVNYPFINGEKKTINVSAEVIDYKPVSLDLLLSLDLDSIRRMDTIKSQPERWER